MAENNSLENNKRKKIISLPVSWEKDPIIVSYEPIIAELLNSEAFKRLALIDQSGPSHFYGDIKYFHKYGHYGPTPKYTRAEHSIGVLALAYKAKRSLNELLAALTHDFSHTPGSHVADHVFAQLNSETRADSTQQCYQDSVHIEFLKHFGIDKITNAYGIDFSQLNPYLPEYTALKAGRTKLDADRIEYVVHTAQLYDMISREQAKRIIDDLEFENNNWFFKDQRLAKIYGHASVELTRELYVPPWSFVFYQYFGKAIIHAIKSNILLLDDFKYGTDILILNILQKSNDSYIQHILHKLEDIEQIFTTVRFDESDVHVKLKFRGVNPQVKMHNGEFKVLTELDFEFAKFFKEVKEYCEEGYGIKYNDDEVNTIKSLYHPYNEGDTARIRTMNTSYET